MATTSLSRQLAALRAPSTSVRIPTGVDAASALSILDPGEAVDIKHLEFSARESFDALAARCAALERFRDIIFENDNDEGEGDDAMDGLGRGLGMDDLLLALSPFHLLTPGQILLQFLINRHSVHLEHPEALFWSALPHHQFQIFNRIVDVLPVNQRSQKYPGWVEAFRRQCHPCTEVGLRRHAARDRGFFRLACDMFCDTVRRQAELAANRGDDDDKLNHDGIAHCFASVILGALEHCSAVGEAQLHSLMPAVVAGLKSAHAELHAAAATVLARVFPRVRLREKVANRAVKVLMKSTKKAPGRERATLAMLLITFKHQRETVDKEAVLRNLIKLEKSLLEVIGDGDDSQREEEEVVFARKVVSALSVLAAHILSPAEPSEDGLRLLEYLKLGLRAQTNAVNAGDAETAAVCIAAVSGALVNYKAMRKSKKMKKHEDMAELCKKSVSACKRVLAVLRAAFPAEYVRCSAVQNEELDILFMDGNEDGNEGNNGNGEGGPTAAQIAVKRILLDNELVVRCAKDFLPVNKGSRNREFQRLLKENSAAVKMMFSAVEPKFLLRQIGDVSSAVKMATNLALMYDGRPKVIKSLLKFILSEEFSGNQEVVEEMRKARVSLEALVLPHLFPAGDDQVGLPRTIGQTWYVGKAGRCSAMIRAAAEAAISSEAEAKKDGAIDISKRSFERILEFCDHDSLVALTNSSVNSTVVHSADLSAIFAALIAAKLKKGDVNSDEEKLGLCSALLSVLAASRNFEVQDNEASEAKKKEKKKTRPMQHLELIAMAKKFKILSLGPLVSCVESLSAINSVKDASRTAVIVRMLNVGCAMNRKRNKAVPAALSQSLLAAARAAVGGAGEFVSFALEEVVARETSEAVSPAMQVLCLREAAEDARTGKSFKSADLPRILYALTSEHGKVRSGAVELLEAMASTNDLGPFSALVKFLAAEKAAILADAEDNVPELARKFAHSERGATAALKALLAACLERDNRRLFPRLCHFLVPLKTRHGIASIAEMGAELLEDGSSGGGALSAVIRTFFDCVVDHAKEPKCWKLIEALIDNPNGVRVEVGNVAKSATVLALEVIVRVGNDIDGQIAKTIFGKIVDLRAECDDSEVLAESRSAVRAMAALGAADFRSKLEDIWGRGLDSAQSKKSPTKRSKLAEKEKEALSEKSEEAKWLRTYFLVELLDVKCGMRDRVVLIKPLFGLLRRSFKGGVEDKMEVDEDEAEAMSAVDNAYAVDLFLTAIHAIVEREDLSAVAKGDSSIIDPDLLVQCIRRCSNPDTKSTALLILAQASAPGCDAAEYVLQNSIQIFTFVGSHFLLKVDSRRSFEVACQAIDIIIPHVRSVCLAKGGEKALKEMSLSIVSTFVDASADMAAHRFKTFLARLVKCLGERDYLWILTLLLLKTVGKKKTSIEGDAAKTVRQSHAAKIGQVTELYSEFFPAVAMIEALLQMMVNLKRDAPEIRKLLQIRPRRISIGAIDDEDDGGEKSLRPADEFDLLRLKALNFATTLLSSAAFGRRISLSMAKSEEEGAEVRHRLQLLIQCAIVNVDVYERETRVSKIHRHLVNYSEKVLEGSLSILPRSGFVAALKSLLADDHDVVRRKALEVFNAKMQPSDSDLVEGADNAEAAVVGELLEPLARLAKGRYSEDEGGKEETPLNRQLAMLALRSFARRFGARNQSAFKTTVCQTMSRKSFLRSLDGDSIAAAAMLCLTEVFASIGPHAVAFLPPFVAWLLDKISVGEDDDAAAMSPILMNSVILSVQKLMENFSGFLNPYFKKFVIGTCRLSQMGTDHEDAQQYRQVANRARHLQTAVAAGIPTHALLPICRDCFDELVQAQQGSSSSSSSSSVVCVSALANILRENVAELDKSAALAVSAPLVDFFQHAFKYRQIVHRSSDDGNVDDSSICKVEADVIEAFLALTLKLSLDDFKPLFYRVFNISTVDQGADGGDAIDGIITGFHVTLCVARRLKGLFEFACETVVQRSTNILNAFAKDDFAVLEDLDDGVRVSRFLGFLLDALAAVFSHTKAAESVLTKNYEEHVNALLQYFELDLGDDQDRQREFFKQMTNCLAELAGSTDDETQWKHLNYQVLLNLRSDSPAVCACVLDVVRAFVDRKGENYLSVLPDAVPFLAEAAENEDPSLEAACRSLVKYMEQAFGQSLDSYFE